MPNLVEITIKADDETAGGFASVLARYYALKNQMKDISVGIDADSGAVTASLIAIKQKMVSIGLADFADINANPGAIYARLNMIKRMMEQLGINGLVGAVGGQGGGTTPIIVPVGGGGHGGGTTIIGGSGGGGGQGGGGNFIFPPVGGGGGGGLFGWAAAANGVKLFAGALTAIGLPAWIASASALHILADGILETAAVVVPATVAFAAFAAAAVPTIQSIVAQEKVMYTVTQAFGLQMPGLSGGFQKIANAVQPNVYVLFGEALNTINNHTGIFMALAKGAGEVLDNLGARAENALGGNGLNGLVAKGVGDLQLLGNIIGNVFGIFGNVLKVLPGYANSLFTGLQGITGAIERITASGFGQFLLGVGLAMHGFILWAGLGATAAVYLGNSLLSLAAKFGLVAAGSTVFDAAAFGAAVKEAAAGVGLLGGELLTLGAAEDIAAAGSLTLEAIWAALGAINPIVWVGAAIGGLIALTAWMASSNTSAQNLTNSMAKQASQATSFTSALGAYTQGLQQANQSLSQTPGTIEVVNGMMSRFGGKITTEVNPALAQWKGTIDSANSSIDLQNKRLATLNAITGSTAQTTAAFNAIGLQNFDLAGMTGQAYANLVTQVRAYLTAQIQLAGFTGGQAAAAQNALTNAFMNSVYPAIQKVITAEDTLMGVVQGGEQAFIAFAQGLNTIAQDAQASGASMTGLNSASLTLQSDFQNQLGLVQKLSDALVTQNASQTQLTNSIASGLAPLQQYASGNVGLENEMVALINNALGPGTVSLQTVNQWINTNNQGMGYLQGTVGGLIGQVLGLTGAYNTIPSAVNTNITNNAAYAIGPVNQYEYMLSQIPTSITTYLNVVGGSSLSQIIAALGNSGGGSSTNFKAMGGVTTAASGGAKSGLVKVGEHGAELVRLPGGSHVLPHGNQAAQMAAMGGGGMQVIVTADRAALTQIGLSQQQIDAIRYEVRTKGGGNVQKAFGYGNAA